MQKVLDLIRPYIDRNGLVQDRVQPPEGWFSGNGVLRTAEACVELAKQGELTMELQNQFIFAVGSSRLPDGCPAREPEHWRDSQDSPDNQVGRVVCAEWCGSPETARWWLGYGRAGFKLPGWPFKIPYYYPNEPQYQQAFGWRAWHGKFLALRCAMCWTAKEKPSLLLYLGWVFTIATTGLWSRITGGEGAQDAYIISRLMAYHAEEVWKHIGYGKPPRLVRWAIAVMRERKAKTFPGGDVEMYARYFRGNDLAPLNFDHWLPTVIAHEFLTEVLNRPQEEKTP